MNTTPSLTPAQQKVLSRARHIGAPGLYVQGPTCRTAMSLVNRGLGRIKNLSMNPARGWFVANEEAYADVTNGRKSAQEAIRERIAALQATTPTDDDPLAEARAEQSAERRYEHTIVATAENIVPGAFWFGERIDSVEDANSYGHYPNRVRVTTDGKRSYHVTLGAKYSSAITAIV